MLAIIRGNFSLFVTLIWQLPSSNRNASKLMNYQDIMNIVLPFKNKLYRFALRLVSNTHDAEEIVQDLLIKIWKKKDDFAKIENKEAWCMTVTRNLAYDKLRSRKRVHQEIETQYDLKDKMVTADVHLEQKETLARIKMLIEAMPEDLRTVIQLRDIEGYTYNEIAEITNWSISKVKVYIHRARKSLQTAISQIEL